MGRGRVLIWCVGFAAGIAAQGRLSLSPATWLATGALATVVALAAAVRGRTPALVVALLVAVSGGWWCAQADRRLDDGLDDFIGDGPVLVHGTVVGHPETADDRAHVVVQLTRVERDDVAVASRARLRLTVMDAPPLSYGDKIQVRTELRRPMPATNPGAFDYRSYLHRQGITLTAFVAHARHLSVAGRQPPNPFMYAGGVVRRWIQTGLSAALPPEAARVAGAVVMGDRRALSPDVEEQFRRAGVSHLLAVSGLHVGFLAAFGFALLQALRVPESWRTVAVLGLVWLYVLATGARAPAVRAGIMTTAATVAASSGRRDTPNALAAAALALLVHNPLLLFDASFQLSFTATAAIVWGYGPILERLRWLPRPVASAAAVTAAAQLGVTPLLAGTFHQLSVVGFAGSLVGSPVASLLVPVGLAAGVAGHVSALPSAWLGAAAALLADILTALAGRLASLSWAFIDVAPPPWTAVVAWWLFWWAVLRFRAPARRRRLALLAAATLAVVSLWSPLLGAWAPSELQLVFLDVGQGDAVLIRTPQGVTALVDGGGNVFSAQEPAANPGESVILPYLRYAGVGAVDVIVNTHPHEDHLQGLLPVLARRRVPLVVDSGRSAAGPSWPEYLRLIEERGAFRWTAAAGQVIRLGRDVRLEVLHPGEAMSGTRSDLNNNSVVMRLVFGDTAALLTGDIEAEAQLDLLRRGTELRADVVKVPHHGSRWALVSAFYEAAGADSAVITVGRNNYGHPSPEVIAALEAMGVRVYRTDVDGAVIFSSDGAGWTVRTVRRPRARGRRCTRRPEGVPQAGSAVVGAEVGGRGRCLHAQHHGATETLARVRPSGRIARAVGRR